MWLLTSKLNNTALDSPPALGDLSSHLMVEVYSTGQGNIVETPRKWIKESGSPLTKPNPLFYCLLSHGTIQSWNITNSDFFAKDNLTFLFCALCPWTIRKWIQIMDISEKEIRKSIPGQFSDNQEEVV